MPTVKLFTWGYYGWGNHTPQLIEAVDAVETNRGFKPPFFVDIRVSRSVRAAGFTGPAFEKELGEDRHRWMKLLGNDHIKTKAGPKIQIVDPTAADDLLDLAIKSAKNKQRILFFCSCRWPKCKGESPCHRTTVAKLVLKAAKKRGKDVQIVEWPGGNPKRIDIELTAKHVDAIRKGRMTVPLGKRVDLAEFAGLPWGSIATLHSDDETLHRLVGPAISQTNRWFLPVMYWFFNPATGLEKYKQKAKNQRKERGLEPALS